ncbi:hypothetical protein [Asticcacaulis excentricus]|uniref:Uncharacterized protein n=1 Tax=Asticcacaulis excentricus TaxID=78587 RepID=A0A3G9FXT1_9CAUL|nr:hypothetical protein [Asticcacaulis excentricus]BBF79912.1 hypothetical protein EM6_0489 [Asticcacaulis excentricus]
MTVLGFVWPPVAALDAEDASNELRPPLSLRSLARLFSVSEGEATTEGAAAG